MASSSFSVNSTTGHAAIHATATSQPPRSIHHNFVTNLPSPGAGWRHSSAGLPSAGRPGRGGDNTVSDRESSQPDSGATTGRGPPWEPPSYQQMNGEDGSGAQNEDTPSSTDGTPSAKRRKTTRGLRGVANLTPEQLARKRANDREAQRAIRERQRLRTEQLEREIADLKATQPHRELQKERQQKEAVEAELADVKRSLAAIVAIIQPILGGVPGAASHSQSYAPAQPLTAPSSRNSASTPSSGASPASVGTQGCWPGSVSPSATTVNMDGQQAPELVLLNQQRHDLANNLSLGSGRMGLDFLVGPNPKIVRIQNGINGAQDSPQYRHVPMKHDWTGTMSMMGTPNLPAPTQTPPHSQPPMYSQPPVTAAYAATSMPTATAGPASSPRPIYARIPRNCAPTCPLDSLLLDFAAERRQRAAEGLSPAEILGPRYPSVSSLLNPGVSVYSHPLSKLYTDILARFPDLSALPERVGVLYLMFLFMRWQIAPTEENYLRLPAWMRPVPIQTEKEHPAWIDQLPYPSMRDKMIRAYEPGAYPFENFFIPMTSTLSVNWPYEDAYVLLADPTGDELMINPVFEQHLMQEANWTVGPAFERAYPELKGCYNLRTGPRARQWSTR